MNNKLTLFFVLILALMPRLSRAQFGPVHDIDSTYATALPKVGTPAPDIQLKTIDGKNFKLSKLKGKFVVIDFWASWCPDCRRDMPEMKRIYERFKDRATFVGVSFDTDKAAWAKAVSQYGINYTQVSELKRMREAAITKTYGIHWIPSYVIVGADGKVWLSTVLTWKLERKLMEIFPDNKKYGGIPSDTTVVGSKGKLSTLLLKPGVEPGTKLDVAIIMHGFMGNKYAPFLETIAHELIKRNIASVRFDFNGHGQSEGNFSQMTVPNEVEDAQAVYRYVRSLPWVRNIALVGHSQGGVVASMAAGKLGADSVNALVLLAPAAVLRDDAIRGNTFGVVYDPLDPPDSVKLFNGVYLGRNYIRSAFGLPIYETAAKYQGNALLIHGTADHIVPYTYSERYHDIWPKSKLMLLEHFDHGFTQNEQRVAEIVANYLSSCFK